MARIGERRVAKVGLFEGNPYTGFRGTTGPSMSYPRRIHSRFLIRACHAAFLQAEKGCILHPDYVRRHFFFARSLTDTASLSGGPTLASRYISKSNVSTRRSFNCPAFGNSK